MKALIVVMLGMALGCAGKARTTPAGGDTAAGQVGASASGSSGQVPTAARPASDCDWIPAADVEAIVGKLTEPPRKGEGGCVYAIPIPQSVLDDRAKWAKVRDALVKRGGDTTDWDKGQRYDIYGFVLEVELKDEAASSRLLGSDSLGGWDSRGSHGGRLGHVRVSITPIASDFDLPREKLDSLAAAVRDRIPDRPFPMVGYSPTETRDVCALLTRQEAEAVLGPLLVAPYRAGNDGPFAYANGPSCGYYTAGHHVLMLRPYWQNGKRELGLNRGIGNLIATVSKNRDAEAADTLEGPWDQAGMTLDGRLILLKGDRALEIGYRTSATDEAGAIKLARIAVERMTGVKE